MIDGDADGINDENVGNADGINVGTTAFELGILVLTYALGSTLITNEGLVETLNVGFVEVTSEGANDDILLGEYDG